MAKGKNGSNPNRLTSSKYEVLVNGDLSDSFGTRSEARTFAKTLPTLEEGSSVEIVRKTTTETFQVMDTFTSESTVQLVTAANLDE